MTRVWALRRFPAACTFPEAMSDWTRDREDPGGTRPPVRAVSPCRMAWGYTHVAACPHPRRTAGLSQEHQSGDKEARGSRAAQPTGPSP